MKCQTKLPKMAGKVGPETEEQHRLRFQVELEFVQCLANPNYIHFLAQRGYLKESTFVNYLRYLLYWKKPEYARFLKYPLCLYFLDLLQSEHFRREVVNSQCCKFIDDQAILMWQHYTKRRTRITTCNNTATSQGQQSNSEPPPVPQSQLPAPVQAIPTPTPPAAQNNGIPAPSPLTQKVP